MKTVYFIRHAQSLMSTRVVHSDWPLSDFGQAQAQKVVPVLESLGIEKLYCSPYLRCQKTVEPFVQKTQTPLETHHDLREQTLLL